eukprot:CAMPEP_0172544864 /NCGR_PEP_ID=MMETSP1067-20121228/14919_1 /TAXON_ID=265564 ORGANISM="Thalassiosira punctigera, Strain Tpunct2005C2" /NCGR_SAMPLE_ID=MMETSP1067 /ASSEMBLY_ACC=CAM_ASM_000444 /LENGTH=71 /DNA_ID=CAMNT_0013331499 /DNA_START=97 /DNA_END=308 /DNA_ORIENTATION=+
MKMNEPLLPSFSNSRTYTYESEDANEDMSSVADSSMASESLASLAESSVAAGTTTSSVASNSIMSPGSAGA